MSENKTLVEKYELGPFLSHPIFPVAIGVSLLTGGVVMEEAFRYYRRHYLTKEQKVHIPYMGQYLEELLICDDPQGRAKELHLPKSGHALQIAHEYFKEIKPKGAIAADLLQYRQAAMPYLHFMDNVSSGQSTAYKSNPRFLRQIEKTVLSIVLALEQTFRANLIQEGYSVKLINNKDKQSQGIAGKEMTIIHTQKQHWPGTSIEEELGTAILTIVPQVRNFSKSDVVLTDFSEQSELNDDRLVALAFGALNLAVSISADNLYFFPDIPKPLRVLIPSLAYNGKNSDGSFFLNLTSLLPKDREPSLLKL